MLNTQSWGFGVQPGQKQTMGAAPEPILSGVNSHSIKKWPDRVTASLSLGDPQGWGGGRGERDWEMEVVVEVVVMVVVADGDTFPYILVLS